MKIDFREFHRIPHLLGQSNHVAIDDLEVEFNFNENRSVWIEEKVDGANMGVLYDGKNLSLRNRKHILRKGWEKTNTPAKVQFRRAWNWMHDHEGDLNRIYEELESPIIVFGEWLWATHSIHYNQLPDLFVGHSVWSVEDRKFLGPSRVHGLNTKIHFVKSTLLENPTLQDLLTNSENPSAYGEVIREGLVVKTETERGFLDETFKMVNKHFSLRTDFNTNLILNKVVSKVKV